MTQRSPWWHVRFFALFAGAGAVVSLAFTQGIALVTRSCALCDPAAGVAMGAAAGLLTGVMQWTDRRREERGR